MSRPSSYTVVSLADRPDLFQRQDDIGTEVWPEFMRHDPVANSNWKPFVEAFPDCQLVMMDGDEILGVVNAVPIRFDGDVADLPDDGWDWGVASSVADHKAGIESNYLMGVQIVVARGHQGKGLSGAAVREMAKLARCRDFEKLIIPVRPSDKHRYPLIPMEEYIHWTTPEGLPRDAWLRVHVRAGGRIIKVCPEAMRIPGTIEEWVRWTDLDFPGTGSYIVLGALNPVTVDREADSVLYIEPNVWVLHEVTQ